MKNNNIKWKKALIGMGTCIGAYALIEIIHYPPIVDNPIFRLGIPILVGTTVLLTWLYINKTKPTK